jgi:hypothetical protein
MTSQESHRSKNKNEVANLCQPPSEAKLKKMQEFLSRIYTTTPPNENLAAQTNSIVCHPYVSQFIDSNPSLRHLFPDYGVPIVILTKAGDTVTLTNTFKIPPNSSKYTFLATDAKDLKTAIENLTCAHNSPFSLTKGLLDFAHSIATFPDVMISVAATNLKLIEPSAERPALRVVCTEFVVLPILTVPRAGVSAEIDVYNDNWDSLIKLICASFSKPQPDCADFALRLTMIVQHITRRSLNYSFNYNK